MKNLIRVLKTIGNVVAAIIILIVAQIGSSLGNLLPYPWMMNLVSGLLYIIFTLTLGLIYAKFILHMTPDDLGVHLKFPELKWLFIGIILPTAVSAFYILLGNGQLVKSNELTLDFTTIIFAMFTVGISVGIVEEFIFRSLIMKTIEKYWGKAAAICIPSFLFGAAHLVNISSWHLLDAVLLIASGTMVGIMFSLIAYQSKNLLANAIVHGFWNMIILGGILEISASNYGMSANGIWQYKLSSSNILLTGGQFGIEAAVPALIGYSLISIYVLMLGKKEKKITIRKEV